ncbi:hypothetical protein [Shimia sp.]
MTNPIAVFLAVLIIVGLGADMLLNNGDATMLLARKFFDLIEWVAFWR